MHQPADLVPTASSSATPGVATSPARYAPVSPLVTKALAKSESVDVVVTVDPAAQSAAEFAGIRSSLRSSGGNSFAGTLTAQQVNALGSLAGVRVDLNVSFKVDPMPTQGTKKTATGATNPAGEAEPTTASNALWDTDLSVSETDSRMIQTESDLGIDGTGVVVAVMDTGVDTNAAGLSGKVVHREDFSSPAASCTDNGYLDPYGHGTHVSSIVAGTPNTYSNMKFGRDIRGVAKGAKIVDLRIFNCAGEANTSHIETALNWVLANKDTYGIKVLNMSLGTTGVVQDGLDSTSILVNRVVAAGVVVAVAAGNEGDAPMTISSPGTAEFATTVGAASVSKYGAYTAPYSSLGPTSDGRAGIDLIAPGSSIDAAQTTKRFFGSTVKSGTSMAAPYVAGLAALLAQQHPDEAPSGTVCELSVSCPAGVVKATMTNPVQDRMKTSDWYSAGVDTLSGAGLVSVSATLLNESPDAAASFTGTLLKDTPNVLRIPPHATNTVVTVYLPDSYKADAYDPDTFRMRVVDGNYVSRQLESPCSLLSPGSCMFGAFSFTPHVFVRLLRPSASDTYLVIENTKEIAFSVNVGAVSGSLTFATGVTVSSVDVTSASSGSMTLTRTSTSASSTTFSVVSSGPLQVPSSVTLPAGPAGTTVSLTVTKSGSVQDSEEKVVFTGGDGSILAGRVIVRTTGLGRVQMPSPGGFDDGGNPARYMIADDGTLFLSSRATGLKSSNGYDGIGIVPAGSLQVTKVPLIQTPTKESQIDLLSIADDGSAFVAQQYPAGAGLVPGDTDVKWTYFVRDVAAGTNTEVGPDKNLWTNWYDEYVVFQMGSDGDSVVWATSYPSGTNPVKLAWQGGTNFGTTRILESFPATTSLSLVGYRGTHIVVRVVDTGLDQFRDYASDGTYSVLDFGGMTPTDNNGVVSKSGTATAIANGNEQKIVCYSGGLKTDFDVTFASTIGSAYGSPYAVADDCSWVIINWETAFSFPRAKEGYAMLKLASDGTYTKLDSSATGEFTSWDTNAAGTSFLRASNLPLEAGDINGELDVYRGLGAADATVYGVKATISHTAGAASLVMGKSASLSFSTDSTKSVSVSTTANCSYSSGNVTALAGTGTCTVTLAVAADSVKAATSKTVNFTLQKGTWAPTDIAVSAPAGVAYDTEFTFTVTNLTVYTPVVTVSGPCVKTASRKAKITSGSGTCRITATVAATDDYEEVAAHADTEAGVASRPAGQLAVTSASSAAYGQTVTFSVTNSTGLAATTTVSGPCTLVSATEVQMTSGTGTCTVTATVESDGIYATTSAVKTITAAKASRPSGQLSVTAPASGMFSETTSLTVSNATGLAHSLSFSGPCVSAGGNSVSFQKGTGTCTVSVSVAATDDHEGLVQTVTIPLRKATRPSGSLGVQVQSSTLQAGARGTFSVTNLISSSAVTQVQGPCNLVGSGTVQAWPTAGQCVITVSVPATDDYESVSATASITVTAATSGNGGTPNGGGSGGTVNPPTAPVKGKITLKGSRSRVSVKLTLSVNSVLYGKKVTIQRYSKGKWVDVKSKVVGASGWSVALAQPVSKFRAVSGDTVSSSVTR